MLCGEKVFLGIFMCTLFVLHFSHTLAFHIGLLNNKNSKYVGFGYVSLKGTPAYVYFFVHVIIKQSNHQIYRYFLIVKSMVRQKCKISNYQEFRATIYLLMPL